MKCESDESFDQNQRDKDWIVSQSPPIRVKAVRKESLNSSKDPPRAEYYCRKCKAHNITKPVKKHKRVCPFIHCACNKCRLVDEGRRVVAQQIAIYRDQKSNGIDPVTPVKFPSLTNGKRHVTFTAMSMVEKVMDNNLDNNNSSPHCRRCRNHQIVVTWKGHKKICPYRGCLCDKCTLINKRKDTEKNLRDLITQKEEGRLPIKHDVYHHYVSHTAPAKFVPSFGGGPGASSTPLYPTGYHPQMTSISHYPATEGPAHLYNQLSMLSNPAVPQAYSASGSSESPGLMDRISQSGANTMPSPALLAASQHMANLTGTGSSAFSNTLKGFNSPTQTNYDMIAGDFKPPPSLSFAHSPSSNVYSRYSWNGLYPNPNTPQENRISANYQHCQTYSNYFSGLQLTPSVTSNSESSSTGLTYRTLANYCY